MLVLMDMKNRIQLLLINSLILLIIAAIDYITTSNIKITAFYLVPIFIATYYYNSIYGTIFALISVIINFAIGYCERLSIDLLIIVNNSMLFVVYLIVIYLVGQLRKKNVMIERTLNEKEIIIGDIHHRMKNQIASLLSIITMSGSASQDDIIMKLSGRLNTYLLLYNNLTYDNKSQSMINVNKYLHEIADYIVKFKSDSVESISVTINGGNFFLNNKTIITIGLIINELMTNSLKHAFAGSNNGSIAIKVSKENENTIIVIYRDDGPGFNFIKDTSDSKLGMLMIRSLIEQLNGSFDYSREDGSEFIMKFSGLHINDLPLP